MKSAINKRKLLAAATYSYSIDDLFRLYNTCGVKKPDIKALY